MLGVWKADYLLREIFLMVKYIVQFYLVSKLFGAVTFFKHSDQHCTHFGTTMNLDYRIFLSDHWENCMQDNSV